MASKVSILDVKVLLGISVEASCSIAWSIIPSGLNVSGDALGG